MTCTRCNSGGQLRRGLCHNCYESDRGRYGWTADRVDIKPVREHLARLRDAGIGTRTIAELSGASRSAINAIINGRGGTDRAGEQYKRTSTTVAAKILAVTPPTGPTDPRIANKQPVDGIGTNRRLQALAVLGWPIREIMLRLGTTASISNTSRLYSAEQVTAITARSVAALYEELSMTPGPSPHATTRAASHGWLGPLEWDDDTIDNPSIGPVEVAHATTADDRLDDFEWLISCGVAPVEAAQRCGWTWDGVTKAYSRAGREIGICRSGHPRISWGPQPKRGANCRQCVAERSTAVA